MHRPFATALFALSLVAASAGLAEAHTHRVSAGETLSSIAAAEHTTPAELAKLNDLQGDAQPLAEGTVLVVDPQSAPPAVDSAEAARAVAAVRAAERASAPTAGADVAMWEPAAAADPSPLHRLASRIVSRTSAIASNLTRSALRFIGVPYSFGGTTTAGFDCSGFVQHVFAMLGIHLPRTADSQFEQGRRVAGGDLRVGDLVFFQTYAPGASHVGIYLGNDEFVHAASHGVTVSRLSEAYWASRYIGAKRIVATTR